MCDSEPDRTKNSFESLVTGKFAFLTVRGHANLQFDRKLAALKVAYSWDVVSTGRSKLFHNIHAQLKSIHFDAKLRFTWSLNYQHDARSAMHWIQDDHFENAASS